LSIKIGPMTLAYVVNPLLVDLIETNANLKEEFEKTCENNEIKNFGLKICYNLQVFIYYQ
jgi:hypothetical protein